MGSEKEDLIAAILRIPLKTAKLFPEAAAANLTTDELLAVQNITAHMRVHNELYTPTLGMKEARQTLELAVRDPIARQIMLEAAEGVPDNATIQSVTGWTRKERKLANRFPNPEAIEAEVDAVRQKAAKKEKPKPEGYPTSAVGMVIGRRVEAKERETER